MYQVILKVRVLDEFKITGRGTVLIIDNTYEDGGYVIVGSLIRVSGRPNPYEITAIETQRPFNQVQRELPWDKPQACLVKEIKMPFTDTNISTSTYGLNPLPKKPEVTAKTLIQNQIILLDREIVQEDSRIAIAQVNINGAKRAKDVLEKRKAQWTEALEALDK